MHGEGVNQVKSSATNGNALTVNGGVLGTMIGGNKIGTQIVIQTRITEIEDKNINQLCIELRKELQASLKISEDVNDNKVFPLLLSNDQLQHRSYCDSEILRTLSRNDISNEIYEQNISSVLNSNSSNVDLKDEIAQSDNKSVIALFGPPMVGKTRLIKSVARNLLKEKVYNYVFYCDVSLLQNTFSTNEVNLFDFLTLKKKSKKWMRNEDLCLDVLEKIVENDKILILFDHFEMLNLNKKKFYEVGCFSDAKAEYFVMNILSQKVLPDAKKVVITKHFNLDMLEENLKNKFRFVNVCGMNHETQLDLIQKKFPRLASAKLDQLVVRDLRSFCFVPCILNSFIKNCQHNGKCHLTTSFAFTMTFFNFFDCLKKNDEESFDLLKLADFAFDQFFETKMCFDQTELKQANLSDSLIHSFFTTLNCFNNIKILSNFGSKSHFNHILVHEFLVALKLMFLPKKSFKKYVSKLIDAKKNCIVIKFVFGICDARLEKNLKTRFSKEYSNLLQNKKVLKSLEILKKLKKQATTDFCDYINEMCDECFAKSVLKQFNLTLFVNGNNSCFLSFKD